MCLGNQHPKQTFDSQIVRHYLIFAACNVTAGNTLHEIFGQARHPSGRFGSLQQK